jgi:hypothetical protein
MPLRQREPLLRVAFALLLSAAAIAAVATWLRLGFGVNDDVAMMRIASGGVTGSPSASLVYVHRLWGAVLAGAFGLAPDVSWYGLWLLTGTGGALALLAWVLVSGLGYFRGALAFAGVFAVAGLELFVKAQFTQMAVWSVLGAGALAAWWSTSKTPPPRRGLWLLLMVTLVATRRWRPSAALAAGLLLAQCLWLADDALIRRDAAWADYLEWNKARAALVDVQDTRRLLLHVPHRKAIGWRAPDVRALKRNVIVDREVFSTENFREMKRMANERETTWEPREERILERWKASHWHALAAALLWLLLAAHGRRLELLAIVLLQAGVVVVVSLYLAYYGKFVDRSFQPVWFGALAMWAAWWAVRRKPPPEKISRAGWAARAALLLAFGGVLYAGVPQRWERAEKLSAKAERGWKRWERWLVKGWKKEPERVVVDLRLLHWRNAPLLVEPKLLRAERLVAAGWSLHSPLGRAQLDRLGVGELKDALLDDGRIVLLMSKKQKRSLKSYYGRWQKKTVIFTKLERAGRASLWRAIGPPDLAEAEPPAAAAESASPPDPDDGDGANGDDEEADDEGADGDATEGAE